MVPGAMSNKILLVYCISQSTKQPKPSQKQCSNNDEDLSKMVKDIVLK